MTLFYLKEQGLRQPIENLHVGYLISFCFDFFLQFIFFIKFKTPLSTNLCEYMFINVKHKFITTLKIVLNFIFISI